MIERPRSGTKRMDMISEEESSQSPDDSDFESKEQRSNILLQT
jgi:hypothetical protein